MPEFTLWAARCGTMLEAGSPSNDILWFLGETVDHKPSEKSPFPKGYKYDYVNRDALMSRISVKNGLFVTPEGSTWKVLWVPVVRWMPDEVKAKLERFSSEGGRIVYGGPDEVVEGMEPDVVVGVDAKGRIISDWRKGEEQVEWVHRSDGICDWYFVAANGMDAYEGEVTFRATGNATVWDPVSGEVRTADVVCRKDGTTTVHLDLAPAEGVFVVLDARSPVEKSNRAEDFREVSLGMWTLSFPVGWGAPSAFKLERLLPWAELPISEEGRHFSGTATYKATFDAKAGVSLACDLGVVETVAEVVVNGSKVRTLWSPPYRCEIDGRFVKDGTNELRVDVTSTWFNRLTYDQGMPESERKTWTHAAPGKDAQLKSSGLVGPVTLWQRRDDRK